MKLNRWILSGIAFLGGVTLIGTAIAQELTNEQKTVICRLKQEVEQQQGNGNKLVFAPLFGRVRNQVESPFRATLYPDVEYTVVGGCDENCQDLNLTVKNSSGEVVASGEKNNNLLIATFTPAAESEYQVTAKPGNCTTTTCNFSMGIFVPTAANVPNASKLPAELAQFRLCQ